MLLGFKRRWAPYVEEGSKTHTIRAERARPPRVGEVCHCYVDPRQKSMRLLGRWLCVRVEEIEIGDLGWVLVGGVLLDDGEKDLLAWRDGFRFVGSRGNVDKDHRGCFRLMWEFWRETHVLPFRGQIIHWDYGRPVLLGPRGVQEVVSVGRKSALQTKGWG